MARVICPACKKPGNVPDQYLGNRIRCPSCGERFTAPTLPPPKGEMAVKPGPAEIAPAPAPEPNPIARVVSVDAAPVVPPPMKPCVYCGETILVAALKCKHCGEFVDPAMRAAEEAKATARKGHQLQAPVVNVVNQAVAMPGILVAPRRRSFFLRLGGLLMLIGIVLVMARQNSAAAAFLGFGLVFGLLGLVASILRGIFG